MKKARIITADIPSDKDKLSTILMNIYDTLLREYGPQGWWPVGGKYFPEIKDVYEIIIGAILTQNTAWKNVERALKNLRERGLIDPKKILDIPIEELSSLIKPSGYYNQKARRLKEVTRFIFPFLKKETVPSREELLEIKGIGPETADSILLYAFQVPIFVIDAYTRRLLERLGLCDAPCSYQKAQALFMSSLPEDEKLYNEYHALIVKHCKDICKKRPECSICCLKNKGICRYPAKFDK